MRRACHIAYTQNIVPRVVDDDTEKVEAIISPADDDSLWLRKGGIDEALPFVIASSSRSALANWVRTSR